MKFHTWAWFLSQTKLPFDKQCYFCIMSLVLVLHSGYSLCSFSNPLFAAAVLGYIPSHPQRSLTGASSSKLICQRHFISLVPGVPNSLLERISRSLISLADLCFVCSASWFSLQICVELFQSFLKWAAWTIDISEKGCMEEVIRISLLSHKERKWKSGKEWGGGGKRREFSQQEAPGTIVLYKSLLEHGH